VSYQTLLRTRAVVAHGTVGRPSYPRYHATPLTGPTVSADSFLNDWPPGTREHLSGVLRSKLGDDWSNLTDDEVFERLTENHGRLIDDAKRRLSPAEFAKRKNWYANAHNDVQVMSQELGVDAEKAFAVSAALSAQGDWSTSGKRLGTLDSAKAQLSVLKLDPRFGDRSVPIDDSLLRLLPNTPTANRDMREKMVRLWRGESPDAVLRGENGWKVRNFYSNLTSPKALSGVTIDRHAIRASVGRVVPEQGKGLTLSKLIGKPGRTKAGPSIASYQYPLFADAIAEAGRRRGLLPHEAQAVSWKEWQDQNPGKAR
jgi:hypothetical protein